MASNGHKLAKKKISLDIRKKFLHRGRSYSGPVAERACTASNLGDTQTLSGRDSEKLDLALTSSGAWCQAICMETNWELSGAATDMPLSVPSSGWNRENQSRG